MSFSAHADAKGIIQMIKHVQPKNVMLVHGEKVKRFKIFINYNLYKYIYLYFYKKKKMEFLGEIIKEYCQLPCYYPANFERCVIDCSKEKKELVLLKESFPLDFGFKNNLFFKIFLFL